MNNYERQRAELEGLIGDKYEVIQRIGGGGMAQVFLARHRFHGGWVAVKVLAEYLAQDEAVVARFEQEARIAASLSGHPNIVPIFDIGSGNGLHYLIMQYVPGEDLAQFLRREGKLTPYDAANILAQVTEGMIWAESKRVVHRDLKPANIRLDGMGRALLLDFGIARTADLPDGLTRAGESLGTPFYMCPEQIRGEVCDARSDLYALGVVFFELLTARHPFEGDSSTAIQMAHLSTPPPSASGYDPAIPASCDAVIQKLLQKRREDRFQSASELLATLTALGVNSGPSVLRPIVAPTPETEPSRSASAVNRTIATPSTPAPVQQASPPPAASAPLVTTPTPRPASASRGKLVLLTALSLLTIVIALAAALAFTRPKQSIADAHGTMLLVPAGSFIFGDNSPDSPNSRQTLSLTSFYVDQTEVSNAEYKKFCDATGHAPPNSADFAAKPQDPVADVTLEDAEAYAAWAGKRLPTEQEWEKAARGTDGRPFPWGTDPWTSDVPETLQPVDSFPDRRSPSGALNMAGNVFEWTTSVFPAGEREYADMQKALGTDVFSKRWCIIKGGSFSPHGQIFFRSSMRRGFPTDQHSNVIGFRCVRDVGLPSFWVRLQSMLP
jgi:serine/threonine-protein kinase